MLPNALAPSRDRFPQSFQRGGQYFCRPLVFANDVGIVGFRSAKELDDSVPFHQRNDADNFLSSKDNQGAERVMVAKCMPPRDRPLRGLEDFSLWIAFPKARPLWG